MQIIIYGVIGARGEGRGIHSILKVPTHSAIVHTVVIAMSSGQDIWRVDTDTHDSHTHTDEWVCVSVLLLSTGWGGVLLSAASDVASLHLKPCTHTHTHRK